MSLVAISRLAPDELHDLRAALSAANLPTDDLSEPDRIFFRFGDRGAAAFAGLEGTGTERLLRSVVVPAERRGVGLGAALVAAVEAEAKRIGVDRLHLLTEGATPFFRALGYVDTDRASAPETIAATEQFRSLCRPAPPISSRHWIEFNAAS
ncbi:GNAT family N-acetyltransferase [Sphingomonas sp. JC676]|uniref:arsenic resistance N-acetyltransferase ArsN2 n=1 Tax=Sphingomonas sp. JC676 TaxID=2768065 RepID=UPI001657972A|nr:arsenic resistance N-acetyltransferase ArsN2 [Sphingomonas sp. JC676]MBC9032671.1 GNAT family N-acetyltransferase [Sphingomonas sp. JC676]